MHKSVLAKALKVKRAAEGLRQQDLADKLGVSVGTIAHAEQGGKPSPLVARLYAEWLETTVEQVIAAAVPLEERQ